MSEIKLSDLKTEYTETYELSLAKLLGKQIKDITFYLSDEFGDVTLKICDIVLADGSRIGVDGEHDFPYLTYYAAYPQSNMDDETLASLFEEDKDQ